MKTGYLETLDEIDFSLPIDHTLLKKVLGGKPAQQVNVHIGMEGWTDRGYVGKIYPLKTKSRDFLMFYSKHFNAVEVNSTRFSLPKKTAVATWKDQTPDGFKFAVKLPQYISHQRVLNDEDVFADVDKLLDTFGILEDKLGTCYLQLPSSFKAERLPELYHFAEYFPEEYELCVELRDAKLLADSNGFTDVVNNLASYNISSSISDLPDRRDLAHMALSSKTAYVRLAGNRLHATDYYRCDQWIDRLSEWISMGLETIYFFVHQPAPNKSDSATLVRYVIEHLEKKAGITIPQPTA